MIVQLTAAAGWTPLPDAPADLGRRVSGMGQVTTTTGTTRTFVSTDSTMYLYNVAASAWDRQLALPLTTSARTVMVAGIPYAAAQNGADAEVYKMLPIE